MRAERAGPASMPETDRQRDKVLAEFAVSRETAARLDLYVDQLRRWQRVKNLVGPSTLSEVWTRHIADALQLLDLAPPGASWLDLGSGAGIPGMIVAIAGADRGNPQVELVESNARKCAFLSESARLCAAPARISNARIASVIPARAGVDIVCARALAPLDQLLEWVDPLLKAGTTGLFLKGREAETELTQASRRWRFTIDLLPSRTDSAARILRVTA